MAIRNAARGRTATAGSTNAVAAPAGDRARSRRRVRRWTSSTRSAANTPVIADLKPGGRYMAAAEMYRPAARALLARELQSTPEPAGDTPTVTGESLFEEIADAPPRPKQDVVHRGDSSHR
jgi:dihydroxy-acid dehydratase